jgi:hypothetical protein
MQRPGKGYKLHYVIYHKASVFKTEWVVWHRIEMQKTLVEQ